MATSSPHLPPKVGKTDVNEVLDKGPIAPGSPPEAADADLALPHERDESAGADSTGQMGEDAAAVAQREVMKQAAADLASGQVDTDLHTTPGLDAQQRHKLLGNAPGSGSRSPRRSDDDDDDGHDDQT
ncbi:hypothetical protein LZ017_15295 [Pelomonas sp. CA6]|uniref:hypothetical protein n=1 Tax=Pelomonas sp. CA6 TaxID=2907999 RepID=UPI001F4C3387|nr:hypothetical protein [Pelomonas sp. CA6]MCH7344745.1 hypothetical protein [Pelomonas sp. CA6]